MYSDLSEGTATLAPRGRLIVVRCDGSCCDSMDRFLMRWVLFRCHGSFFDEKRLPKAAAIEFEFRR
jgi:hypothetical protein